MNRHALDALEFDRVLEIVATYATSELGAEAVLELRPSPDAEVVAESLHATDEMVSWRLRDEGWAPPYIPNLEAPLERLAVAGAMWSEAQLVDALRILEGAREVRRAILPVSERFPRLARLAGRLIKDEELQRVLRRALDVEAVALKDDASPELARLRRTIRNARSDLVRLLEAIIADLPDRLAVPNASVTLRADRYCIPIRREGRSEVGGIVHDESASRATLFVEPPAAIEPMNELRELHLSEKREMERILRELTDAVRPRAPQLRDTLARLVRLDTLFARASYALKRGCSRPKLVERDAHGYRVVRGRHPVLLETMEDLVPFDLTLNPGEHTLLITGPNAGGKTVLLKATGLISAMAQSGILPPVGQGTEIPVFDAIFADIGDEQSIDASLSTFTAHLRNLTAILERAGPRSLNLIDEIGGATDPVEGAALARAVLLELADRACMTLATSHLGALNALSGEHAAIVNAGLSFDPERLEPLYRLVKGRPGRSYALAIAQRVGFPQNVLDVAESGLSAEELDVGRLLAELEEKERQLETRLAELAGREEQVAERERVQADEVERLEERSRAAEREAHERAREFLLEARKKLDEALKADRAAAREARSEIEASLRDHSEALRADKRSETAVVTEIELEAGDRVWVESLEKEGRVVEVRDDEVVVEMGAVKLQLSSSVLSKLGKSETPKERTSVYSGPELEARSEIDLRGLVADEARMELMRALDSAVQAGLGELRVIHGKGTGALRQAVDEYARGDGRIKSHRLGTPWEGGSGVTVLELE